MLIEFSVENFRSFKERHTFSLAKGGGSELHEENVSSAAVAGKGGIRSMPLLRSAVIYGPNAAGKSNLVRAVAAMKKCVLGSAMSQRGDTLDAEPYQLDVATRSEASEFEAIFIVDQVRFQYGFRATRTRVAEEWLYAFPKGSAQTWIERDWNESNERYDWGGMENLSGQKQLWKESTRENELFLSKAIQLNSEQLRPVFDWFRIKLQIINADGITPAFSAKQCTGEGSWARRITKMMRWGDESIADIQSTEKKLSESDFPPFLTEEVVKKLQGKAVYETSVLHRVGDSEETVAFELDEESTGTQKLFSLAGPWIDVLRDGLVLFVDELNTNLHPSLMERLVLQFHNSRTNKKSAQLVFTTHDTSIMNQQVFRRDQIWFVSKKRLSGSCLIPLSDYKPRKKLENLERNYLLGRYGALPELRRWSYEELYEDEQEDADTRPEARD